MFYVKENKSCSGFIDLKNGLRTAYLSESGYSLVLLTPSRTVIGRDPVTFLDLYLLHFIFKIISFGTYYNHPVLISILHLFKHV